jgi:hypothetical protein
MVGLTMIVMFLSTTLAGCCTCREQYEPALKQWQENLERLRPTMQKGANMLPTDLGATKMSFYDRTTQGISRVRGEGPEVWGAAPVTTSTGGDR